MCKRFLSILDELHWGNSVLFYFVNRSYTGLVSTILVQTTLSCSFLLLFQYVSLTQSECAFFVLGSIAHLELLLDRNLRF